MLTLVDDLKYEGVVRIGTNGGAIDVHVRVPDVEEPNWFGFIDDEVDGLPKGEVSITLMDADIYREWSGTAVVSRGWDGRVRLLGGEPFAPPVGG